MKADTNNVFVQLNVVFKYIKANKWINWTTKIKIEFLFIQRASEKQLHKNFEMVYKTHLFLPSNYFYDAREAIKIALFWI
jgi:hypothetical protein